MAEFPNDGEHWLPSDIFMAEPTLASKHGLNNTQHHNINTNTHYFSSCMNDLTQRLSALTLLKQKQRTISHSPSKPNLLQSFEPVHSPVRPVQCHCQACSSLINNGFNKFLPKPDYNHNSELYHKLNRVNVYLENRERTLRRQHHHQSMNQNRVLQNRFGFGGLAKVSSGGTGVFHPRVLSSNNDNAPVTSNAPIAKKKQVMTRHNKPEIFQLSPQKNSITTKTTSVVGHWQISPPEMGLPKDWTY